MTAEPSIIYSMPQDLGLAPTAIHTSYVMLQVTEHPLVSLSWNLTVELQSRCKLRASTRVKGFYLCLHYYYYCTKRLRPWLYSVIL